MKQIASCLCVWSQLVLLGFVSLIDSVVWGTSVLVISLHLFCTLCCRIIWRITCAIKLLIVSSHFWYLLLFCVLSHHKQSQRYFFAGQLAIGCCLQLNVNIGSHFLCFLCNSFKIMTFWCLQRSDVNWIFHWPLLQNVRKYYCNIEGMIIELANITADSYFITRK